MTIRISVVICTHNRAPYLRKALRSLMSQTISPDLYEIIIVDNLSKDDTPMVVNEFSEVSNLRYIFEPVLGAARARNTGVKAAKGEFIAFLDDDAIADPNWLAEYLEAFQAVGPDVGMIGGSIDLIWEAPRPKWIPDELLGIFSFYHYSDSPVILNEQQWLSACNLACLRTTYEEIGGFREDLDRRGNILRASAEVALRKEMDHRGYRSYYYPKMRVQHHISPMRVNKEWFRNLAFWQGRSHAIMNNPKSNPLPFFKRLEFTVRWAVWGLIRFGLMFVTMDEGKRFRRQFQCVEAMGVISGVWKHESEQS